MTHVTGNLPHAECHFPPSDTYVMSRDTVDRCLEASCHFWGCGW